MDPRPSSSDAVKQPATETRFDALARRYGAVGWSEDRLLQLYFEKFSALCRQRLPEMLWQLYSELEDELEFLECEAEAESFMAAHRV